MRQLAWLSVVPKPPPGSKREAAQTATEDEKLTRLARMKKDGVTPPMPPNPMPHIVDRFIEIGMVEASGMGSAPLGWTTIDAWQRVTGVELAPWESRLIRKLSLDYLGEKERAEVETCPPPWSSRATSEAMIRAELRMLDDVLG